MYRRLRTVFLRVAVCSAVAVEVFLAPEPAPGADPASPAEQAKRILAATGVRGGLIVHLGCGDGTLTAALGRADGFLVLGLDRSADKVAAARKHAQDLGLYGPKVSVDQWEGDRLPLVDDLVNLLVVEAGAKPSRDEMLRVLAPQGVAYLRAGGGSGRPSADKGGWEKIVKPRPGEMDEWTHYLYDATGNAVSRDKRVSPPKYLQWVGSPRWTRHHDHMSSFSAMVSAGGRVFYILDEGSISSITLPSRWHLIARDAFSGVVLWKKTIPRWWTRFTPLKSGPAILPRRLVAQGQHVYVTLGLYAPVSQLDAATGKVLQTYPGTENTWEIVLANGLLYAVTGSPRTKEEEESKHLYEKASRAPGNPINKLWTHWDRKLLAIDPATGKLRWQTSGTILPGTLAVAEGSAFFHNGKSVVALDAATGKQRWARAEGAIDPDRGIPTGYMPSLVVRDGIVVLAGGQHYGQHMRGKTDKMVALDAADGKVLWEAPHYTSGYQSPQDLLVAGRTVLSPFTTWLKPADPENNHVVGTDLKTGTRRYDNKPDVVDPVWFIHHRCYPAKATEDYLLLSKEGVEFIDLKTRHWQIHHWIRGACLYGIMPANGLLYAPMHSCACSADMKLNGLNAVAGSRMRPETPLDVTQSRLTKGPAYADASADRPAHGKISNLKSQISDPPSGDWPTFRHDAARSGRASCAVSDQVKQAWRAPLGGKLTAPVVAGGTLYVAAGDRHVLYALDANAGAARWTFMAGGRIDSPPTVYQGAVLFGSRDGCVYCLRAKDGQLAWRFRAVADDRRLVAREQVESAWPVHGSVLVRHGEVLFVAGRSAFLDGGLQMVRLEPRTGRVIARATFDGKAPDGGVLTGGEEKRLVGLSDVLSADGGLVFMRAGVIKIEGDKITKHLLPARGVVRYTRDQKAPATRIPGLAVPHLFSSYGFLDDSWLHRSYWVYAGVCSNRHSYFRTGQHAPAGRILVCDAGTIYGFGRQKRYFNWTTPMEYRLFAERKAPAAPNPRKNRRRGKPSAALWETKVPILATGLVLAGETLFAAGAPDVLDETQPGIRNESPETVKAMEEQEAALAGRRGGVLLAVSKTTGKPTHRCKLDAPPVFDGLIAARGALFVSLKDGSVQCWKQPSP